MYCRYCGKILTTADNLDRCYPSCPESLERKTGLMITLQPYDYVALVKERDALRAENERLREALSSLYEACMKADEQGELSEYVDGSILDRVGEALSEVKEC